MLLSLGWWTILLNKKNTETFDTKVELIKREHVDDPRFELDDNKQYLEVRDEYKRQRTMIFGEAMVFGLMLIAGIWLIYRAFKKEFALSQQQNNFLLSITHELKTPLASIGLTLDTFKKRQLSEAQSHQLADNALEETKRLENIVDNLLVTSRLQTKPTLNKEKINVKALVDDLVLKLQRQYSDHKVLNEIEPDVNIDADKESIQIVLKNIIENALKYSPPEGDIRLRSFDNDKESIISCEDKGRGISDFEKSKVTEKFYRVGSEETRTTKGTGLGLYLADQIVKAHGYKLQITDNVPKGTVINIIISK